MRNSCLLLVALATLLGPVAPLSASGLELSGSAARRGDSGLEAIYTGDRQKNYLVRDFAPPQDRVVTEFFIRIDDEFSFGRNGKQDVLQLVRSDQRKPVASIRLLQKSSGTRLQFRVRDGNRLKKIRTKLSLPPDEWVRVTIDLTTASSPNARDGSLRIFKNTEEKHLEAGLDNGDLQVDSIRFGQVGKPPASWEGEIHFDELVVRKSP